MTICFTVFIAPRCKKRLFSTVIYNDELHYHLIKNIIN